MKKKQTKSVPNVKLIVDNFWTKPDIVKEVNRIIERWKNN